MAVSMRNSSSRTIATYVGGWMLVLASAAAANLIDHHQHLISPQTPAVFSPPKLITAADLIPRMDAAGIDRAVDSVGLCLCHRLTLLGAGLSGTESLSFGQDSWPFSRLAQISGRYQVNADCSGGVLNVNGRPAMASTAVGICFCRQNFDDLLFLNESPTSGYNVVAGEAKKF